MEELPDLDVAAHLPLLARALEEDHAAGDVTAHAVVPADAHAQAVLVARASGVLAGLPLAEPAFRLLDDEAEVELLAADGEVVGAGTEILRVAGRARAILGAERVVLNLLAHLSGIATLTQAYVEATMGTGTHILDTRKTLPGWRALEKYAVLCGGGHNHRAHLGDAMMVKENHLLAAFGRTGPEAIAEAIRRCREAAPAGTPLCVEVENLKEVDAALESPPDVLMLDGFDLGTVREAVRRVRARGADAPALEITGGVTLENVGAFAAAGAGRISVGALTHSARALDLSLRLRPRDDGGGGGRG